MISTALDVRDKVLEVASAYETVAALDLTPEAAGVGHAAPGSRLPPGMQEVLDTMEVRDALTAVDEWAEFCAHILLDECELSVPKLTPARLRLVAANVGHFIDHADEMLAMAFDDDLHERLRSMRRLSKRGTRRVQTGMRCQDPTCRGHYVSPLGTSGDRHEDAIICDKCDHRVPHAVWSSWPRARVQYVTPEHAAKMLGTTVGAVRMRASRGRWGRIGTGRDVRYSVEAIRSAGDEALDSQAASV